MSFETKTLPSGIVIENRPYTYDIYRWYIKDTYFLHNEGAPSIEYKSGTKCWQQHDKDHRLDGPAIEWADGNKFYYISNYKYNQKEYWKHPDVIAFKYLKGHPELEAFV